MFWIDWGWHRCVIRDASNREEIIGVHGVGALQGVADDTGSPLNKGSYSVHDASPMMIYSPNSDANVQQTTQV